MLAGFPAVRSPEFLDPHRENPAFRPKSRQTRNWTPQPFLATLSAIFLFGSIAWTQAANFYINASGPVGNGSGSSASNAADASSASKYGAIVQAHNAPGTVIVYAAGTFQAIPTLPSYSNVTHQGAGIGKTIIRIPNGGCASGTNGGSQLFRSQGPTVSGFKFFDATVDFNTANQPAWANRTMCSVAFVFFTPDHCTIQRVKFINLCSQQSETFVIFFNNGGAKGNCNNNLIDSCIFTQPMRSGNVNSGMTLIYLGDWLPYITVDNTNIVNNCQFINLKYPDFSDIHYVTCVTGPMVTNCTATGIDGLWGCEPGSQGSANSGKMYINQTCQVTGNTVSNSGSVGGILLHPDTNGAFGSVNVQNNTASLDQHPYQFLGPRGPQFFSIQTAGGSGTSSIGNVTIQNNTVTAPPSPWTVNPRLVIATSTSPSLFRVNSLTIINNQMISFPGDGSDLEVNKAQVRTYTNRGNTFASDLGLNRPSH
jgi:hypothetical protein